MIKVSLYGCQHGRQGPLSAFSRKFLRRAYPPHIPRQASLASISSGVVFIMNTILVYLKDTIRQSQIQASFRASRYTKIGSKIPGIVFIMNTRWD